MKRWRQFKISSAMLLLGIMLAMFNHCVGQLGKLDSSSLKFKSNTTTQNTLAPGSPSPIPADSRPTSIAAFTAGMYTITRARCVTCHASLQAPLHAHPDAVTAHDQVINTAKVNFQNPAQSRMVLKLQEGHNCWGNCTSNANEMLATIEDWQDAMLAWQAEQDALAQNNNGTNLPAGLETKSLGPLSQLLNNQAATQETVVTRAQNFTLIAPMVQATTGSTTYAWVPNSDPEENLAINDATAGRMSFVVNIPATDNYKMYALVDAPTGSDNSIYVIPKNGQNIVWRLEAMLTNGFEWREVTSGAEEVDVIANMIVGMRTVTLRQREDGIKVSAFAFSRDPDLDLADLEDNEGAIAKLRFNLQPILGINATINMDIEEFDEYTYKVSNLSLTSAAPIHIKNIRFLLNDVYNPQHSTYTYLNGNFPVGTEFSLSPSSMLVLKDQGPDVDVFSLQFEELSIIP